MSRQLGLIDPGHLAALHLTLIVSATATAENADPSLEAERRSLEAAARYEYELSGYAAVQSTRPQLIAYGLTDSPGWRTCSRTGPTPARRSRTPSTGTRSSPT